MLSSLKKQLQNKGYATIPFPISRDKFNNAIEIFFSFLRLPLEIKEPLFFKVRETERGNEVGYRRYRREEGKTDNREYVHYHRFAETKFADARKAVPEFDALLSAMKEIHDQAVLTMEEIIRTFDTEYPNIYNAFFSPDDPGSFYLRFLKYDLDKPGEFLAKGHYDRGACTLALAESNPGLRMGTNPDTLREVVHRNGEALFFPALRFQEITSPEFVPTWHDVIQKEGNTYSDNAARWAVVFFADPRGLPNITYEEAHTPRMNV